MTHKIKKILSEMVKLGKNTYNLKKVRKVRGNF